MPCTNSKQHLFGQSPSKNKAHINTFQTGNQDTSRRQGHQSTEPGSIEGFGSNEMGCTNNRKDELDQSTSENDQRSKHTPSQTGNQDTARRQGHQSRESGPIEGEGSNEMPCTNSKQHLFRQSPSKFKALMNTFQTGNQDTSRRQGHQSTEPGSIEGLFFPEIHRRIVKKYFSTQCRFKSIFKRVKYHSRSLPRHTFACWET
ncbi:uncharacterized protein LOC129695129 [Leucoraja erinacea]|uniref:uncharacterized protein LOC129695129 n=1 Tax=Leucoraja erinaceus TaxID=7782 RepID=UPI00245809D4|nr:uncharacterized protein LOC129695129 [Leucoraja erinacea]